MRKFRSTEINSNELYVLHDSASAPPSLLAHANWLTEAAAKRGSAAHYMFSGKVSGTCSSDLPRLQEHWLRLVGGAVLPFDEGEREEIAARIKDPRARERIERWREARRSEE